MSLWRPGLGKPWLRLILVGAAMVALSMATPSAGDGTQQAAPALALSDAQVERFLLDARVIRTRGIRTGVTGSVRATLSDGTLTHDAQIQTVEEKLANTRSPGFTGLNAEDSWRFNVAAYRIDRLLGLELAPVSVSRTWHGRAAAFTWWVDDVLMDEGTRLKNRINPPDSGAWIEQMDLVRILDQLIDNRDRNGGNLLISRGWRVWAIDHTRAFRIQRTLKSTPVIKRCDRQVLERLRTLDRLTLEREIGGFVSEYQIEALLARRDAIVELLDKAGLGAVFVRRPA